MDDLNISQIVVSILLSSGLIGGIMALFTKTVWSPESRNELSKMGNEFARQLLADAKAEREELRLTIRELEASNEAKTETIARLRAILTQKDETIKKLERNRVHLALKLRNGEAIHIRDIFGGDYPDDYDFSHP
jgi:predicted nuclease with TOPRIM domain